MALLIKKLVAHAVAPMRATEGSAGYDLSSAVDAVIPPNGRLAVSTGIAIGLPEGTYGRIGARSGLAFKYGIDVFAGIVDRDYRGEVKCILYNSGDQHFFIKRGDRIAQLILEVIKTPDVAIVLEIDDTVRGTGGFGSTGV
jgi:dUTP pyrophosphatase